MGCVPIVLHRRTQIRFCYDAIIIARDTTRALEISVFSILI